MTAVKFHLIYQKYPFIIITPPYKLTNKMYKK